MSDRVKALAEHFESLNPLLESGLQERTARNLLANPQAHIDALVEAGVLERKWCTPKVPGGLLQDNHYAVVQPKPHEHSWEVRCIHGDMIDVICGCGDYRALPNKLPIEVPK